MPHCRVAVLGAGVAGLLTARALQRANLPFTVFETEEGVGGVWRVATHGTSTQETWRLYQFPEYPFPAHLSATFTWDGLVPATTVQQYSEDYANDFSLLEHIRFRTTVVGLARPGGCERGWLVTSECQGQCRCELFTFVIICLGTFQRPRTIRFSGEERYQGTRMVSRDLTLERLQELRGQRVIVMGGGKSAVDACAAAAEVAASVHMLFRKAYWWAPRFAFGCIPIDYMIASRLGVFMAGRQYYTQTRLPKLIHQLLKPLRWLYGALLQMSLKRQYGLPPELVPKHTLAQNAFSNVSTDKEAFVAALRAKRVTPVLGEVQQWLERGVQLKDGRDIGCDAFIWAVGYERPYSCLEDLFPLLGNKAEGFHLYRNLLPVNCEDMAFVQGEALTPNAPLTAALQAEWLARLLQGKVKLPPKQQMASEVEAGRKWRLGFMPVNEIFAGRLQNLCQGYYDELMTDMGEQPYRKGWAWLREWWQVYTVQDYVDIIDCSKPRHKDQAGKAKSHEYGNGFHEHEQ
ncbi:hypothetical protein WJX73_005390 [Symbiochloris irregularis]|uniref:Flavin-containing monooxygenase n=1 Tax=Symbiochloris irregularis TaxID=706552 RepID=A0AAW1PUU7_9CHLO